MALRFCFLLAFFSVPLNGGLNMNSTSRADDPFEDVRSMIREAIKNENLPSLTVAVVQDGKICWQEGFGLADREKNLEATSDTMYSLASQNAVVGASVTRYRMKTTVPARTAAQYGGRRSIPQISRSEISFVTGQPIGRGR